MNAGGYVDFNRRADRSSDHIVHAAARHPEIEQLRATVGLHHNVFGLDVAVEDVARMRGLKRFGELRADLDDALRVERAIEQQRAQRAALHQLHHQKNALAVLAHLIDSRDSRMMQARRGTRLRQHLRTSFGRARGDIRENLDGHGAKQALVVRAIHDPHPSAPKLRADAVMRYRLANHA